ncbi:hypothetical protein V3C99_018540 [Haemonchus contortus]
MARGHLISSDEKARHEVWRAVRRCENITRKAMEKVPRITDRHRDARLGFAKMNLWRDWAKGKEELKRALIEAWRATDEEHLRNLVSGQEINMTRDLAPELSRRKRAA